MEVFRELNQVPASLGETVATIGNFDGVHVAHTRMIAQMRERARQLGAASLAITFEPHPTRVLRPERAPKLITPLEDKLELLASAGLDTALVLPFTHEFSLTTARLFAQQYLKPLRVKEVHEGDNFHFGHGGSGNVEQLAAYGRDMGFQVIVYPELRLRGLPVSSSRIRQLIAEGRIAQANRLLGRPFSIRSHVATGRGIGSVHVVPTVNLDAYSELVPANGVYVTRTRLSGRTFDSVTNVGVRPTFGADSFAIESYLLDFEPFPVDEGMPLEISFLFRLRDEMKWPSPEALRNQIAKDVRRTRRYFELCRRLLNARTVSGAGLPP